MTLEKLKVEQIALAILDANAMEIRDIGAGEEPFLYSSGNHGPGYISIKGLVGRKDIMKMFSQQLAICVAEKVPNVGFIAGNVTGGMIPGWQLSEYLEMLLNRTIPFVYIRDTRKKGGQKELITGIAKNPEIAPGMNVVDVEELVNFAETTCNGAEVLREAGYEVTHAATILSYENPVALTSLKEANIEMISLLTLEQVLLAAEKYQTHPKNAIDDYKKFLEDPLRWQKERRLELVKEGGTK